jgi:RHS repeat-associated protein
VQFDYNANFWLSTVTAAGSTTTFGYDNDGLLTTAQVGATTLTLARNLQNGMLEGTTTGTVVDDWTHNAFAEPVSYVTKVGSAERFRANYGRDSLGRIETHGETVLGEARDLRYGYDVAGRLETVHHDDVLASRYHFDANSNREQHRIGPASALRGRSWACLGDLSGTADVLVIGSYDGQDRMRAYGTCGFDYGANGELERRTDTATGEETRYRYDVFGNLRDVTLPDGREIEYLIDGRNRRIGKSIDGQRVQGLLYVNQLNPIAELDGAGNVVANFVYADRPHVPSLMLKGGRTYRIFADHLGSVRLVVDIATGEVAQQMAYDEYGNVVVDTQPGFQPFGYAGGIYDRDTGLVRFGARDYDPISGRWTAKDPIRFGGKQSNLYLYVDGDSINRIDSRGKDWQLAHEALLQVLNVGPLDALSAWDDKAFAEAAVDDAIANGMGGEHNGDADAFRHCVWSCAMSHSIGTSQAQSVGGMHEILGNLTRGQPMDEARMDLANNEMGRQCGEMTPSREDCVSACMNALMGGLLQRSP